MPLKFGVTNERGEIRLAGVTLTDKYSQWTQIYLRLDRSFLR